MYIRRSSSRVHRQEYLPPRSNPDLFALTAKELKTCGSARSGGEVCCSADMELRLQARARDQHEKATKETLQRMHQVLSTRGIRFHSEYAVFFRFCRRRETRRVARFFHAMRRRRADGNVAIKSHGRTHSRLDRGIERERQRGATSSSETLAVISLSRAVNKSRIDLLSVHVKYEGIIAYISGNIAIEMDVIRAASSDSCPTKMS